MMDSGFQQFLLLDALLENWDGIRVLMGKVSPSLEEELMAVATQLGASQQPGQAAVALDHLLDLVEDTQAYEYVQQLIRRSTLPKAETTRGAIGDIATAEYPADRLLQASAELGAAASTPTAFLEVPIFFATNRKVAENLPLAKAFGGDYVDELSYGFAEITIPTKMHRLGNIERPLFLIGRENTDSHITIATGETCTRDRFASLLAERMAKSPSKELLVFLHGYRVTFEEAARRAAQVAHDISFGGAVLLFSWPSAGSLSAYPADEDSAIKSAEPLRNLLRDLEGGPWKRVHLLAHSMGNRVMVAGLTGGEKDSTLPIQNVVLVAADVDIDHFKQQFPALRRRVHSDQAGLVTSYASATDRALGISSWLHRNTRVGRLGDTPLVIDGLESVDATATDTSLLGLHHGYFAGQRSVLTDIGLLVRERLPAARRGLTAVNGKWWMFPK